MGEHRDKRDELMALANELNRFRVALLKDINETINPVVAKLVNEAEKHLVPAVDEAENETRGKVRKPPKGDRLPIGSETSTGMATLTADVKVIATTQKTKRTCSICRQSGHKAPNCPQQREW